MSKRHNKKSATNLSLHDGILEMGDRIMSLLKFGSLSTLVEHLIREEYQARNGRLLLQEDPADGQRRESGKSKVSSRKIKKAAAEGLDNAADKIRKDRTDDNSSTDEPSP